VVGGYAVRHCQGKPTFSCFVPDLRPALRGLVFAGQLANKLRQPSELLTMTNASFDAVASDAITEPSPSRDELREAIEQLMAFRDRIVSDVTGMGQKLKMTQQQVAFTLAQHPELQRIESVLAQLQLQIAELA